MSAKLYNKGFSELSQLAVLLGMCGVGLITGSLASMAVWKMMTGQGIMNMAQDMMRPENAGAIKVVQALSTFFIFFVPAVAYAFICFRNGWLSLGVNGKPVIRQGILSILVLAACMPAIGVFTDFNQSIPLPAKSKAFFDGIEKSYEEQVKVIANVKTVGQYLLSLFMIALLPAVFEEFLFRGGIQNMLSRFKKSSMLYILLLAVLAAGIKAIWLPGTINNWLFYGAVLVVVLLLYVSKPFVQKLNGLTSHFLFPIICTSILFSAIHGSWYGFLPRMMLGIVLGLIFYFTQNIFNTILAHFVNNASIVTMMWMAAGKNKPVELNQEFSFPWWAALVSVVLLYFLFTWLWKLRTTEAPVEIIEDRNNPFANYRPNNEQTDLEPGPQVRPIDNSNGHSDS
jgi:membrane protease YdiL (CAAX protease family)